MGETAKALPLLEAAHNACPSNYDTARVLAAAEIAAGDLAPAQALISSLLQQQDRAELHDLLERIASAKQDYKTAALQHQTAATMDQSESNIFDFGTALFRLITARPQKYCVTGSVNSHARSA